jgi:hypothetical protein
VSLNLKPRKRSWIGRVLLRELWPDSLNDSLLCYARAVVAFAIGLPCMFLGGVFVLGLIAVAIGVLFVTAGVGLQRDMRWAAWLASALLFVTGSFWLSIFLAQRAEKLRGEGRGDGERMKDKG